MLNAPTNDTINGDTTGVSMTDTGDSSIEFAPSSSTEESKKRKRSKMQHSSIEGHTAKKLHVVSPMLKWLLSDSDTPTLTLVWLEMKDLAVVNSTCKGWYQFMSQLSKVAAQLDKDGCLTTEIAYFNVAPSRLLHLRVSSWLHAFVHFVSIELPKENDWPHYTLKRMNQDVLALTYFRNIELLELAVHPSMYSEATFRLCFTALKVSLRDVYFRCVEYPGEPFNNPLILQPLLSSTEVLSHLHSLHVSGSWQNTALSSTIVIAFQSLSFAFLRNLKNLVDFEFQIDCPLSKLQVLELIQCPSLQSIPRTIWIGTHTSTFDGGRSREQWIAEGVAQLHHLPQLQNVSFEGHSDDEGMTSDCLMEVCKIQSLTTLHPVRWSSNITANEYQQLVNLSKLEDITYDPTTASERNAIHPPSAFWTVFLQCSSLRSIKLKNLKLSTTHLRELFANLSELTKVDLLFIRLESLLPFSNSKKLATLRFYECRTNDNKLIHWPTDLPTIPSLKHLHIDEPWLGTQTTWPGEPHLTAAQAKEQYIELFRFALRSRMPLLNVYLFHVTTNSDFILQ